MFIHYLIKNLYTVLWSSDAVEKTGVYMTSTLQREPSV